MSEGHAALTAQEHFRPVPRQSAFSLWMVLSAVRGDTREGSRKSVSFGQNTFRKFSAETNASRDYRCNLHITAQKLELQRAVQ